MSQLQRKHVKFRSVVLLIFLCPLPILAARPLEIYFVDVEHGNATLIVSPSGQSMLIDGGNGGPLAYPGYTVPEPEGRDVNRVLRAMDAAGVRQIDYLVVTHYHRDHYGAIPGLAKNRLIVNWVDHGFNVEAGRSEEWAKRFQRASDELYKQYLEARSKGNHINANPGDKIPIAGLDVLVLTSAAKHIAVPVNGAGAPNAACAMIESRPDDESEDGQSVGLLVTFGKFRFINLGDLTWNYINNLFCPNNLVGHVDVYMTTHHGGNERRDAAQLNPMPCCSERWSRGCCSKAELQGLSPRVAIFNMGPDYPKGSTPEAWQNIHSTPGLEDVWQTHYKPGAGDENNASPQFIANLEEKEDKAYWIKLSADADGSFTITNARNGYRKNYPPRSVK